MSAQVMVQVSRCHNKRQANSMQSQGHKNQILLCPSRDRKGYCFQLVSLKATLHLNYKSDLQYMSGKLGNDS